VLTLRYPLALLMAAALDLAAHQALEAPRRIDPSHLANHRAGVPAVAEGAAAEAAAEAPEVSQSLNQGARFYTEISRQHDI
jgi:hypothetical protein